MVLLPAIYLISFNLLGGKEVVIKKCPGIISPV